MSIDGPGLYQDDTAHDVRSEFKKLLASLRDGAQGADVLVARWSPMLADNDVECSFYLALADTEWHLGCLDSRTSRIAMEIIDSGRDLARWDYSPGFRRKRKVVLDRLRKQLVADQPAPRIPRVPTPFQTPWAVGDVLTYSTAGNATYVLAVVAINENAGSRFAIADVLEWDGVSSLTAHWAQSSNVLGGQRMMLTPFRRHDLPAERVRQLGRWRTAEALTDRRLFPYTLVRWDSSLDRFLTRPR